MASPARGCRAARNNVRAKYRKGIGVEGLVKSGQLSMLLSRPLGVKGVTNPLAAGGAQDPEQLGDARANAPLKVLTLDRVVSLRDYENFARAFARHRQGLGDLDLGRAKPRRAGHRGRSGRRRGGSRQRDVRAICSPPCAPPAIRSSRCGSRRFVRRIFVSPAISRSTAEFEMRQGAGRGRNRRCASNFPSLRAPSASR